MVNPVAPDNGTMNLRDFLERLFWTTVVAGLASTASAALFDIEAWKAAAMTGLAAGIQCIVVYGRYRLSVLPNPGEGLPGLPVAGGNGG